MGPRRCVLRGLGLLILVVLAGCSGPAPGLPAAPNPPAPALGVVAWGVFDGRLSVLVRNDDARSLRSARVVISARDASGGLVAAASGTAAGTCCLITNLPPDHVFGVYADLGAGPAQRVRSVSVAAVDWVSAATGPGTVAVGGVSVVADGVTSAVSATLLAGAGAGPFASGQAVLVDATGRLVSVVTQRYGCITSGIARMVTLPLPSALPPGTVVRSVTAYPLDAGAPATAGVRSC